MNLAQTWEPKESGLCRVFHSFHIALITAFTAFGKGKTVGL